MTDTPKKLGKLQITNAPPPADAPETIEAIVKVRVPDYVPDGVRLRARVDATMFTATIPSDRLTTILEDPNVQSVERSKRLRIEE